MNTPRTDREDGPRHYVDIVGVTGSNPVAPTTQLLENTRPRRENTKCSRVRENLCRVTRPLPALTDHDIARFWDSVDRRGPDECWPWQKATASGYGRFKVAGRLYGAHRVACTVGNGLPDDRRTNGSWTLHSCDNRLCCNPAHLRLGSARENVQEMAAKGRAWWQK